VSAIIDIMKPIEGNSPFFTVNNTVDFVEVQFTDVANYAMSNAEGKYRLAIGDNFNILSLGVSIPLGFEHYQQVTNPGGSITLPYLILSVKPQIISAAEQPFLPEKISLPFENYELSINQYIYTSSSFINVHAILSIRPPTTSEQGVRISMLNVPDSLNGKTFSYSPFVKIEHSFELVL